MPKLLFPDASVRSPVTITSKPRTEFYCPCHEGTWFTVSTLANVPQASCPVCGSVCEPYVPPTPFMMRMPGPEPTSVPSAGTKTSR